MSEREHIDTGRRAFFLGRWNSNTGISAKCLNHSGIYCQSCKESCNEGAIIFKQLKRGLQLPMIVVERCTQCNECVDSCPADAITISQIGTG